MALTVHSVLAVGASELVRTLAVVVVAAGVAIAAVLARARAARMLVVGFVGLWWRWWLWWLWVRVGDELVGARLGALALGARVAGKADAHDVAVAAGHALAAVLARVWMARI